MTQAMQHYMPLLCVLLVAVGSSWQIVCAIQLFNYPTFSAYPRDFNMSGASSFNGSAIWLTYDTASWQTDPSNKVGRFFYNQPVQFMDDNAKIASFSTSFTFQIVTGAAYGNCGDGMAFFIGPNITAQANSIGGSLGLLKDATNLSQQEPNRHLFAVEFDTYENKVFQDPSSSHIGIDINSLDSVIVNDTRLIDHLYLYNNYTYTVWIEYNASNTLIQVWMTNISSPSPRPVDPILSSYYNLSSVFQKYMYVGFSASTGSSYEGHVLFSWSFSTSGLVGSVASTPGTKRSILGLALGLGLSFSVATCVAVASLLWYCTKLRSSHEKDDYNIDPELHRYSYRELSRATQAFSDKSLVGEGAFSRVYKAIMRNPDGSAVAVKRLNKGLGDKAAFASEIRIISRIRHRNLLRLRGWCHEKGKAMLVYDYMGNGSLDRHLFGGNTETTLTSERRFNILLGVAAALEYLHEGLAECVLHRDVKAANVLLDAAFGPVLGDFGLARLIGHDRVVTMTAAETPGYVAPEVPFLGKATDRADVYSFGVLALEVACGRRVLDFKLPPQERMLVEWVWLLQESNKLMEAMDSRMVESAEWDEEIEDRWRCVLHLGLVCCHPLPEARPRMSQVHQALKEVRIIPLPASRPDFPYSTARPSSLSFNFPESSSMTLHPSLPSSTSARSVSNPPTFNSTMPTTSSSASQSSFPTSGASTISASIKFKSAPKSLELQSAPSWHSS